MSSTELTEWIAYYSIDPFGNYREDLRMGISASLAANISRDSKRRPEPFTPQDFMPFIEKEKPNQVKAFRKSMIHLVKKEK